MRTSHRRLGFTLIELLVVVAIIALLIGVLLPALGKAREQGRTLTCANNQRQVATGLAAYTASNEYFPPSYVYGAKEDGLSWREKDQLINNPNPANGYVHWSANLFEDDTGSVPEGAFECPSTLNGGAPATNPGSNVNDWEAWQENDTGNPVGSATPKDRQVKRMAMTGNAAIFPRNKFGGFASLAERKNRLVNPAWIQSGSRTILATEFYESSNWQSIADDQGQKSKSHRPITPFLGKSSGTDVYREPGTGTQPRFKYPFESEILTKSDLDGRSFVSLIDSQSPALNAVGRVHAGGDSKYGGTANFVFVDGHVQRLNVIETVRERLWGEKFYSLTGTNTEVDANVPGN